MKQRKRFWKWFRWPLRLVLVTLILLLGPLGVLAFGHLDLESHWSEASMASTGQAPDPRTTPEAVVQVYAARAYNWRGAFAVHTWIAAKPGGADHYTTYQVIGWNLRRGLSTVTIRRGGAPDFLWYNAYPQIIREHRGAGVDEMIRRIEAATQAYPYPREYRAWPGPNSNTFIAFIAREVPELELDLPPTAIGKDYLGEDRYLATLPSGSGWQLSLYGVLGVGAGWEEGLEFNLLGLSAGIDLNDLGLRLPGVGRVALLSEK